MSYTALQSCSSGIRNWQLAIDNNKLDFDSIQFLQSLLSSVTYTYTCIYTYTRTSIYHSTRGGGLAQRCVIWENEERRWRIEDLIRNYVSHC